MQDLFLLKFCWGRKPTTTYRIPIIKFCALTRLRKNKIRWHSRHLFISRWSSRRSKANKQKRWNTPFVFFSSDKVAKKGGEEENAAAAAVVVVVVVTHRQMSTNDHRWKVKRPITEIFPTFFLKIICFLQNGQHCNLSINFSLQSRPPMCHHCSLPRHHRTTASGFNPTNHLPMIKAPINFISLLSFWEIKFRERRKLW